MDGAPTYFADHKGGFGTLEVRIDPSSVHPDTPMNPLALGTEPFHVGDETDLIQLSVR